MKTPIDWSPRPCLRRVCRLRYCDVKPWSIMASHLPDDTKPVPESILTYHQWGPVTITRGQFHKGYMHQSSSTRIDQSHRYERHQAACREPAGSYDKTTRTAICFEHKTQYLLIRAPCTRIVVFWHISNIPHMISQSQINCNTPTLYIAAIFVRYCYTTGSRLL